VGSLSSRTPGQILLQLFLACSFEPTQPQSLPVTDPLLSRIVNRYSDEILHRSQLSPLTPHAGLTSDRSRVVCATARCCRMGRPAARGGQGASSPRRRSAFRDEMCVHGKLANRVALCGTRCQLILSRRMRPTIPKCQTGGKLWRSEGSRDLLREDWPRTLEELESPQRPR